MNCPECKSTNLKKMGFQIKRHKKVQKWQCKDCGRITIYPEEAQNGQSN